MKNVIVNTNIFNGVTPNVDQIVSLDNVTPSSLIGKRLVTFLGEKIDRNMEPNTIYIPFNPCIMLEENDELSYLFLYSIIKDENKRQNVVFSKSIIHFNKCEKMVGYAINEVIIGTTNYRNPSKISKMGIHTEFETDSLRIFIACLKEYVAHCISIRIFEKSDTSSIEQYKKKYNLYKTDYIENGRKGGIISLNHES